MGADAAGGHRRMVDQARRSRSSSSSCVDISKPIPADALLRETADPSPSRPSTARSRPRRSSTRSGHCSNGPTPPRLGGIDRTRSDRPQRRRPEHRPGRGRAAESPATSRLVLIVGPAGTGKTTALRPAVAQLRAQGRAVFGVAPSADCGRGAADETGVAADTLDKLLIEHRLNRPPDHRYDLPAGATVIVDEAGMLPTTEARRTRSARRPEGVAGRPRRRPAAILRRRPRRHVRAPRRHLRRDRTRPSPPLRQRLGTRSQPPTPSRRRQRRRGVRRSTVGSTAARSRGCAAGDRPLVDRTRRRAERHC